MQFTIPIKYSAQQYTALVELDFKHVDEVVMPVVPVLQAVCYIGNVRFVIPA